MQDTPAHATQPRAALHGHYPHAQSVAEFRQRLEAVQARITAACARAGRHPTEVRLLPVSKTIDEAHIRMAHAAGCRELGENKPQELAANAL